METTIAYKNIEQLPNPHWIEIRFVAAMGIAAGLGAIPVLLKTREFIMADQLKLAIGAGIFMAGMLFFAFKCLKHFLEFRLFIYGAKPGKDLSPTEHDSANEDDIHPAVALAMQLRSAIVKTRVPTGPFKGLLCSAIKPLLTAPPPVQAAAERHFHSFLGMAVVLIFLCISYISFRGTSHEGMVSWFFMVMSGLSILSPFLKGFDSQDEAKGKNSFLVYGKVVLMFAMVVAGPDLIARHMPAWQVPPFWIPPVLLLSGSMIVLALFFFAAVRDIKPIATEVDLSVDRLDMNGHPEQVFVEFSRELRTTWKGGIENRHYADEIQTDISDKGTTQGLLLEETQPVISDTMYFASFDQAWGDRRGRNLILLATLALLFVISGSLYAGFTVQDFGTMNRYEIVREMLIVYALFVAAFLSVRIGSYLWSRVRFRSRLFMVYLRGTYQNSEFEVGNTYHGQAKSSSTLTRIQDAMIEVAAADIETVAYGIDSDRHIMNMEKCEGLATKLSELLKDAVANLSVVALPTAAKDAERLMAMVNINSGLSGQFKQLQGQITFFDNKKGYGRITSDDGQQVHLPGRRIPRNSKIRKNQRVSFNAVKTPKGMRAENVALIGD